MPEINAAPSQFAFNAFHQRNDKPAFPDFWQDVKHVHRARERGPIMKPWSNLRRVVADDFAIPSNGGKEQLTIPLPSHVFIKLRSKRHLATKQRKLCPMLRKYLDKL